MREATRMTVEAEEEEEEEEAEEEAEEDRGWTWKRLARIAPSRTEPSTRRSRVRCVRSSSRVAVQAVQAARTVPAARTVWVVWATRMHLLLSCGPSLRRSSRAPYT